MKVQSTMYICLFLSESLVAESITTNNCYTVAYIWSIYESYIAAFMPGAA
jgi:hypothetical protein